MVLAQTHSLYWHKDLREIGDQTICAHKGALVKAQGCIRLMINYFKFYINCVN